MTVDTDGSSWSSSCIENVHYICLRTAVRYFFGKGREVIVFLYFFKNNENILVLLWKEACTYSQQNLSDKTFRVHPHQIFQCKRGIYI